MGDYIKVPKATMSNLGNQLINIKQRLNEEHETGGLLFGLDDKHGQKHIGSAESSFQDKWKTSIEWLTKAIGSMGEVSKAIGDGAATIDAKVGEAAGKTASGIEAGFNLHN